MSNKRAIIGGILVGVLLFTAAVGVLYLNANPDVRDALFEQLDINPSDNTGEIVASGFIEAEEVQLAAELGGRVKILIYEEGDEVDAGDMLMQLDTSLLSAQRGIVQASVDITTAQRDLLKDGVREEVIRQAEAQVAVVSASVEAARVALNDIIALRNNPQDLLVQLAQVEAQVAAAQAQVDVAQAQFQFADKTLQQYYDFSELLDELEELYGQNSPIKGYTLDLALAPQRYDAAVTDLNKAEDSLNATMDLLGVVQGLVSNPQALEAQVIQAQTALSTAEAQLAQASAQLDQLRAGPTDDQLAVADAQVQEAVAQLASLETRIDRMVMYAPIGGVVLDQLVHTGELASPGVPLVTLANLDVVELTVYVTAGQFDSVALGQTVRVQVDSFPGRSFDGTVIYIADEAEFTPRSIQTREERVNLVYAVKIRLENPDHALKPGMPADAYLGSRR